MNLTNPIFITLISVSPTLILLGYVLLKFPPKSINSVLGYRTKQSKSSIDKWNFAQPFSAIQMMKSGVVGCVVAFGAMFLKSEGNTDVFIGLLFVLVLALYPIYKTEKTLKQKFGR